MDPLRKMMNKYSLGRRSSVDPMRIQVAMDESSLTSTADKRHRSGIPKLLVPASTKKRRSSSCDRSHASWSTVKASDRSNAAGLLFTPQHAVTPKMSLSARAAVDCISQLSIKSQTGRKDNRSISDKAVQMRLARHVCSYLNKTGLVGDLLAGGQGKAPSGAIQPTDLKNMNKNAFITLFNLLYKELGARSRIDANSPGFQEKIPAIAKKLGYPGIINKSHLLTPSSPHSWPYIIAFLAWIVDLVEAVEMYENVVNDRSNIPLAFMGFHLKTYNAYNNKEIPGPPPPEYVEKFTEELCIISGVKAEEMEELLETRNRLKAQLDAELEKEKTIEEELLAKQGEVVAIAQNIEGAANHSKELDKKIANIKQEAHECEANKKLRAAKLEELRREKETLAITCSQQKMSKAECDKLVSETKELQADVKMIGEVISNIKKTIDKTDLQISSNRNKLNKKWMDFMNATMPMHPDVTSIKKLLDEIQNFNPLHPDAAQCFKQIEDALQHSHSEITAKVSQDQAQAKVLQDKMHELTLECKNIYKKDEEFKKLLEESKHTYKCLQESFAKEVDEFNKKIDNVKTETRKIQAIAMNDGSDELQKLKEMERKLQEELAEFKQKSEVYFKTITDIAFSYHKIASEKMHFFVAEAESLLKEQINMGC